ncbi:diguanylate cyclase [Marinobacter salinisoli]|uniref:Diguanylate cyclase n=1 Tax=Marinobacter salinisoli TaxID=2769486 RepID=A0ABX7MQW6_9GAMM|nr:diguanylate cyclase [Marinobacter salinisoli]QSP93902.1 diguanylate cyclase [Marinobacter salinisoli]
MGVTRSIQFKLVTILILCALLFVLALAPILSYISFTNKQAEASQQQARLVGAVTLSASIAAFVENEQIAEDVINGLLLDDEISQVRLTGAEGFVVESGAPTAAVSPSEAPMEYVLRSPLSGNQEVGALHVWPNNELINARAIHSVTNNIIWLVVLCLVFLLVSILAASKLVGIPLRDLARQLAGATPGSDLQVQVAHSHRKDEIGLLAHRVNSFLKVTREAIETERNLRLQIEKLDRRYRNIFASTHVGIMVLDGNGFLLHGNPVLLDRIVKLDDSQKQRVAQEEFFNLAFKKPDDAWGLVARARKQGETVSADLELNSAAACSSWVHCLVSGTRDEETNEELIEAVLYDVTSRVVEATEAQKLAEEDPLTGLKNRRGCQQFFEQRVGQGRKIRDMAVMLLDLDGFKSVNDSLGHAAGDYLLQLIAERLQSCVRSNTDLVGRFGGDEFVVMVEVGNNTQEAIDRVARQILKEVSSPVCIDGAAPVQVGVSIGIALTSQFKSFDELIDGADKAMYQVKAAGKHSYGFSDASGW